MKTYFEPAGWMSEFSCDAMEMDMNELYNVLNVAAAMIWIVGIWMAGSLAMNSHLPWGM